MCVHLHIELLLNQDRTILEKHKEMDFQQFFFLSIMERSANYSLIFVVLCHFFKILSYVVLLFLSVIYPVYPHLSVRLRIPRYSDAVCSCNPD